MAAQDWRSKGARRSAERPSRYRSVRDSGHLRLRGAGVQVSFCGLLGVSRTLVRPCRPRKCPSAPKKKKESEILVLEDAESIVFMEGMIASSFLDRAWQKQKLQRLR